MSLPVKPGILPPQADFLFELDPEPLDETLTGYGGIPLLIRAARSLEVSKSVQRHLHIKQRQRGLDEASYVESFLVLNALGGEWLDDFDRLREDEGLREMLGYEVPSPEATFSNRWTRRQGWDIVMNQLAVMFGNRLRPEVTDAL